MHRPTILIAWLGLVGTAHAGTPSLRLPDTAVPLAYRLDLRIDPEAIGTRSTLTAIRDAALRSRGAV